jgi:filamentous hemagglutinin family protein
MKRQKFFVASLSLCSGSVWALPTGHELIAGQAAVTMPTASQMNIDQTSQRAAINWQGFSVAANEAVNIQQPNANAALLNRVVGQDASQIQGQLNANGQVYLVNPNGVMFSKTAQVDVGGLIATTHNIQTVDFMNGTNHFTQDQATGKVENHGSIHAKDGGAKTHTLTTTEMPNHTHALSKNVDGDVYINTYPNNGGWIHPAASTGYTSVDGVLSVNATGGCGAHNNLQPYIVVYRWLNSVMISLSSLGMPLGPPRRSIKRSAVH